MLLLLSPGLFRFDTAIKTDAPSNSSAGLLLQPIPHLVPSKLKFTTSERQSFSPSDQRAIDYLPTKADDSRG